MLTNITNEGIFNLKFEWIEMRGAYEGAYYFNSLTINNHSLTTYENLLIYKRVYKAIFLTRVLLAVIAVCINKKRKPYYTNPNKGQSLKILI